MLRLSSPIHPTIPTIPANPPGDIQKRPGPNTPSASQAGQQGPNSAQLWANFTKSNKQKPGTGAPAAPQAGQQGPSSAQLWANFTKGNKQKPGAGAPAAPPTGASSRYILPSRRQIQNAPAIPEAGPQDPGLRHRHIETASSLLANPPRYDRDPIFKPVPQHAWRERGYQYTLTVQWKAESEALGLPGPVRAHVHYQWDGARWNRFAGHAWVSKLEQWDKQTSQAVVDMAPALPPNADYHP